jgi:hypothetical protein
MGYGAIRRRNEVLSSDFFWRDGEKALISFAKKIQA